MESQPQNPEFRTNSENFHPCINRINTMFVQNIESLHQALHTINEQKQKICPFIRGLI